MCKIDGSRPHKHTYVMWFYMCKVDSRFHLLVYVCTYIVHIHGHLCTYIQLATMHACVYTCSMACGIIVGLMYIIGNEYELLVSGVRLTKHTHTHTQGVRSITLIIHM